MKASILSTVVPAEEQRLFNSSSVNSSVVEERESFRVMLLFSIDASTVGVSDLVEMASTYACTSLRTADASSTEATVISAFSLRNSSLTRVMLILSAANAVEEIARTVQRARIAQRTLLMIAFIFSYILSIILLFVSALRKMVAALYAK